MARVLTFVATPAAVGGGLTVLGDSVARASFVGVLAAIAIGSFRAITAAVD
jgi:hypothetical protein